MNDSHETDPIDVDLGIFSTPVNAINKFGRVVDMALPGTAMSIFLFLGVACGGAIGYAASRLTRDK